MSSENANLESGGFVPFYRSYTKTWIHAVATAGLTAFGTLTIVHRWFAALALASYVVPPVVLYLRHGRAADRAASERDEAAPERSGSNSETESERAPSEAERTEPGRPPTESGSEPATSAPRPEPNSEPVERNATTGLEEPEPTEPSAATELEEPERREWHAVETPAEATLRDVVVTGVDDDDGASDAYAAGDGGIVLAGPAGSDAGSDGSGDEWTTVLEDGPAAGSNALRGVDATADGAAVWVAGDGGALGRIDAGTGRHTDYTAPEGITDNWLGVAVGGASGAETILLINGSGAVLRGEYRADGDGSAGGHGGDGRSLEWTGPEKPGSGSSFSGIALVDAVGYCCDTNDGVYETTDGGESFERVGLEGADGTLTDVATAGVEDCLVSADDGVVHRYDGPTWTPERVADGTLHGIARRGDRAAASAADGAVHERPGAAADWERTDTGADAALLAVSLGDRRAVAVGEDGTVVARG